MRFWWLALATPQERPLESGCRRHPPSGGGGGPPWAGVLSLNAIRHWRPCNDDWLDNAWLCMRNHAGRGTQAGARGRGEEGEGDDDARSRSLAGSRDPRREEPQLSQTPTAKESPGSSHPGSKGTPLAPDITNLVQQRQQ